MKNQLFIFSKNRACQLHLLLESIEKNSNNIFDSIIVIYTFSNKDYFNGYQKLISRFPGVSFIVEDNFHTTTINNINSLFEFTTFMVDDNVFYKKIDLTQEKILSVFDNREKPISCFSLRLGLNCNYSHPGNLSYKLGNHEKIGNFNYVNIREQKGDFAYPLSVDGHIFKTDFIKKCLHKIGHFSNPNVLESKLQNLMGEINPNMVFLDESVIVGVPVNIVNDTHKNRQGIRFPFSENDLNIRYNNNEVIDYITMDFNNINGPHKEIEYKFKEFIHV
jgi:hypothetical protein